MNDAQLFRRGPAPVSSDAPGVAFDRPAANDGRPAAITQILSIVRRRKWVIVGSVLAALLLSIILTLLMTPQYTASSTLEIRRETANFIDLEDAQKSSTNSDWEFYDTQYGLLTARSLAEHVATELKLSDDPAFFREMGDDETADELFENGRPRADDASRQERLRIAANILLRNVGIAPREHSRLVMIQFTSPRPELSKAVVDGWAQGFIQETLERRFEATSYARNFLESRLAQLRERIDESERQLVSYASAEGIINIPVGTRGDGSNAERSLVADNLARLNEALSIATAERIQAGSRLNARAGEVREALDNTAIATLRQRRAEAAADYAKMMVQFEPGYPPARALQSQINQLDQAIAREESRVANSLRETYEASVAREEDLRGRVDSLKSDILELRRRSIQYNIFQRDVDTNRQLYDALLQRYKEIGVAGGVGVNNISIVDTATTPTRPSSPRLLVNVLLALFGGFAFGAAAAFALEQIDQGISDPTEVETDLSVPLLGTVPKSGDGHPMEVLNDRKSSISEAYQSLQTSLAFTTDHGLPRTLVVTSSRPAEGKTTTAYALARSIARTRKRVLLIDADMRSPSIHHLLGISNHTGLSNYLSGTGVASDFVVETQFENFYAMPAGPQPPSAPELLSGDRLPMLIEEVLAQFSHIVFDVPPVMGLADAPLIASMAEGTVFVVESNGTQKGMAQVAIGRLRSANAAVLGAVLTKFDARRAHYGYGYDYGYGYGYGAQSKDADQASA